MLFLTTLGLVEILFDPVVDRTKREFVGATTIKRGGVDDQLVVFNGDMVDATVRDDVNICFRASDDVGGGICAGVGVGGQSVGVTSYYRCSGSLWKK